MENKEPASDSDRPKSAETVSEPIKTKGLEPADATQAEASDEPKPTQNGEPEPEISPEPEITENGEEPDKPANPAEESKSTEQPSPPDADKHEPEQNNNPEDKPVRPARGTKRKANDSDKNESTNDSISSETTEQKENFDSKNNINVPNDSDLGDDDALKTLSESNIMGKGKRARVPNKRYSDILLSPNRKSTGVSQKSIDVTEPEVTLKIKEEPLGDSISGSSSPGLSSKKNKSAPLKDNLQDPKYLKPFKYGWKRELVWRSTSSNSKRMGDIYYYTPTGKKVRSFREVSDQLNNRNLSLDNFSFTKEPLGIDDPEREIIRNAKVPKSSDSFCESPVLPKKVEIKKPKKVVSPKASTSKTEPVVALSRMSTPKAEPAAVTPVPSRRRAAAAGVATLLEKEKRSLRKTPPSANKKTVKMSLKKGKSPLAKKPKPSPKIDEPMEVDSSPPPRSSSVKTSKICQPCSIRCEGLQGIVPTLQCRVCLCLYHHECVGLSSGLTYPYVCKNCQDQGQAPGPSSGPITSPPPLTPINSLKSGLALVSTTLPKLQRIPRPDSSDPVPILQPPLVDVGRSVEQPLRNQLPRLQKLSVDGFNRSLVGSVTSWLPHNARIINSREPAGSAKPQFVEFLAGRKFLVIPKHNYLSVSATSRPEDSASAPPPIPESASVPDPSACAGPSTSSSAEVPLPPETISISDEVADIKMEPLSPSKAEEQEPSMPMKVEEEAGADKADVDVEDVMDDEGSAQSTPSQPKPKKRHVKVKSVTQTNSAVAVEEKSETKFMENYLQNLSFGYNTLLYVFQYLKVQDLLRAGCVCTMWRDIASHPLLWRTVRMKNSQVHSFEGLANTLKRHGTAHLDLRKMLLPSNGDDIWPEFSRTIARVDTLRKIELCRCPATVVEQLAVSNPNLEVINAVTIKCESMNLDPFKSLARIQELRLKSTSGLNINSIGSLRHLKTLKILSLTSVNDLHELDLEVIAELTNLESLDLGECTDFPKNFGQNILAKLEKLEKLRLEKGQGDCHTFEILEAAKGMKGLEQLELVNFDVKAGFDKALGACTNIKKLMIIPTYISQSATTNNMVLSGVLRLQGSLTHFVWGVTLELLRVTELFVDQCEDSNKKEKKPSGNGDSIPVLKPVPDLSNGGAIQTASNPPQVEILPLPNLQKLLLNSLPTTRVKILKIPFHATWRQTLTDSV